MEVSLLLTERFDFYLQYRTSRPSPYLNGIAHKWLYSHGGRKWETFYSPEAREVQRRFFDHFLKGEPNGWETTPRVRLAVRRSREVYDMRTATDWPLPEVTYVTLYLDAVTGTLTPELPANEGMVQYDPRGGSRD